MVKQVRYVLAKFEDVVFPPLCAGCRKRGTWFCDRCRAAAQSIPRPICHRCGQPTLEPLFSCERCEDWPHGIGSMRAAFIFGGPIREQVHRFKYQGEFARVGTMATLMFEQIVNHEFVNHVDWNMVAHVPLHQHRRRQRGFDQAELIARHLARRLDLPTDIDLVRVRDTPTQVGRGVAERKLNVCDAFAWRGEPLTGQNILLVDDVITTGATMMAACLPLLHAGARRVDGFAFARETLT